jgi:hypothetical protein
MFKAKKGWKNVLNYLFKCRHDFFQRKSSISAFFKYNLCKKKQMHLTKCDTTKSETNEHVILVKINIVRSVVVVVDACENDTKSFHV